MLCCYDKILGESFSLTFHTTMRWWIFKTMRFPQGWCREIYFCWCCFEQVKQSVWNKNFLHIYFDDATVREKQTKLFLLAVRKTLKCVDETQKKFRFFFCSANLDILFGFCHKTYALVIHNRQILCNIENVYDFAAQKFPASIETIFNKNLLHGIHHSSSMHYTHFHVSAVSLPHFKRRKKNTNSIHEICINMKSTFR
jgi:hypothetical protein